MPARSTNRGLINSKWRKHPLLEIVVVEGPLRADRLCRLFVRGAGRQRVGRQLQGALDEAIRKAVRDGRLQERRETVRRGATERILWTWGSRSVSVRPRGNREFVEIPASEVAVLMTRLERLSEVPDVETLHRFVLAFYETKRMTSNIRERLQRIDEERDRLLQGNAN